MQRRDYVTMNVYWFGLAFMWNALHPIVLPALLLRFVPEAFKNTYLGGMTFAGLILAMVIQPIAGGLSDRTRSRWGRRGPWIAVGTLCALVALAAMAISGGYWALLVAYLLLQVASNGAHGPAQGLIPDLVSEERRGLASGIKNLFDMGGLVVASLVAGQLMGDDNPVLAFVVIGALLLASSVITLLGSRERSASNLDESAVSLGLRDIIQADFKRYPDYARLLVSRFFILLLRKTKIFNDFVICF